MRVSCLRPGDVFYRGYSGFGADRFPSTVVAMKRDPADAPDTHSVIEFLLLRFDGTLVQEQHNADSHHIVRIAP